MADTAPVFLNTTKKIAENCRYMVLVWDINAVFSAVVKKIRVEKFFDFFSSSIESGLPVVV